MQTRRCKVPLTPDEKSEMAQAIRAGFEAIHEDIQISTIENALENLQRLGITNEFIALEVEVREREENVYNTY